MIDARPPAPNRWADNARQAVVVTVLVLSAAVAWMWRDLPFDAFAAWTGQRPLAGVRRWHYQLDAIDVASLSQRDVDMLVTDYAQNGGKQPLTPAEVGRLKIKPDGSRRIVISYLSIGEAEEFRYYWSDAWKQVKPPWLDRENCAWPKAWMVRYWDTGWRDLIVSGPQSYLKRIIAAGFDGVYLDRVDMWENVDKRTPDAKVAMIDFVIDLAATARRLQPGFIVIAQNAEDLLEDRRYRRTVDAIAKEELLFSKSNTGGRNASPDVARAMKHLRQMRWQWKPVFPVEYLLEERDIAAADREERALGLVPVFPTRALDGRDPTLPVALKDEIGTPEFIKAKCPPGTSW